MRGTFTIPPQPVADAVDAERVRIGSERRYIVLARRYLPAVQCEGWSIEYRTDDPARARDRRARTGRRAVILDTERAEVIR